MSLILMKNEGRTIKVRFAPSTLVIFLILLLLVPICLGISLWLNVYLYSERTQIAQKQVDLQREINSNAQKIARLTSLEQFLEPRSSNLLNTLIPQSSYSSTDITTIGLDEEKIAKELEAIAGHLIADTSHAMNVIQNTQNAQSQEANISLEMPPSSNNLEQNNTSQANKNQRGLDSTHNTTTLADVSQLSPADNQTPPLTPSNINIQELDLFYVLIEDVVITANSDSIKIDYVLRNAGKKSPLAGEQHYYLLSTKDGHTTKTPLEDVTNTSFRIKFLKQVKSVAGLGNLKIQNGDSVLFEIFSQDELVLRKAYPIT